MKGAVFLFLIGACGGSGDMATDARPGANDGASSHDAAAGGHDAGPADPGARTIFVIPLENKDEVMIYGDTTDAPYLNGLMGMGSGAGSAIAAYATDFQDELPIAIPSEPHYIWMEAGTNVFSDYTFSTDSDASGSNSTSSTAHLSTQLTAAGRTWIAYQEGITQGTCPIASSGEYAAKHSPFIFFQDVSGSPPSASNAGCEAHYKVIGDLATDMAANTLPNYAFITPDLCNEMHGDLLCPSGIVAAANIAAGDAWLSQNLPPLLAYTHTHDATIFLVWDEGDNTRTIPFMAIGDHIKPGPDATTYNHSSMLKTVEELLAVPPLAAVGSAADLSAMFDASYLE